MDDLFPTAEEISQDFKDYAPALKPVTVTDIDPDTGAVLATAEDVTCLKRVHMRGNLGVGDGSIPDERCRFWLLAQDIPFTVERYGRILDADGVTWIVDQSDARALGALIVAETNRARS